MHPAHFNQVAFPNQQVCGDVVFQHGWQVADRTAREDVAQAIAEAESMIEDFLGYPLLPEWFNHATHLTERPNRPELYTVALDVRLHRQSVKLNHGMVISGGVRAQSLEDAASAITWSDVDGDGVKETGTVSWVSATTDPEEIRLYYPNKDGDDRWEIRPINVSIAGGTITVTFSRWLCVLESLQETLADVPAAVNGTVDANFLSEVDAYRVYNDPQTQATFLWEPTGQCGDCGSCAECQYTAQTGCLIPRDPTLGIMAFSPATWDADTEQFNANAYALGRIPDLVRFYYRAGFQDWGLATPNRTMNFVLARAVTRLATSLLDRPVCGCNSTWFDRWQQDLAVQQTTQQLSSNWHVQAWEQWSRWGTTAGAVAALRLLQNWHGGPIIAHAEGIR